MLESLSKQPILLAFATVIVVSVLLAFLAPKILKFQTSVSGQVFSHSLKKFWAGMKRHPIQVLIGIFIVLALLGMGYFYYLSTQPIQISAAGFVSAERQELSRLQKETGIVGVQKASDQLLLLDIREVGDFSDEHIQGALNISLTDFRNGKQSINPPRRVAIYTWAKNLQDAKEVADAIKKQKMKKIYIIKDGYEALKAAGLVIQKNYVD